MVFARIFKGDDSQRAALALYDGIVEQARQPVFYIEFGVADQLEGRFDLIVLHLHLVLRPLSSGTDPQATKLAQKLFDAFFHDMDRSLRAIGVGDMSIGKKVKDMVRAFYGRSGAYEAALAESDDAALVEALVKNLYNGTPPDGGVDVLARYVRRTAAHLAETPVDRLIGGKVEFPSVDGAA